MRKILGIYGAPRPHWVGDGFPVRSILSHATHGRHVSPFLLLDYAGPMEFAPAAQPRGVGVHPHKGFETVTIVYQGEVAHRDSTGSGGIIGPGDVQWMTAASGILHEEFHSESFTRTGGTLEMVQLWVNLPARDKSADPAYQTLRKADIPEMALPDDAGRLRIIAGRHQGRSGPARTFTPMNIWDVTLERDRGAKLTLPNGHTLGLVVLHGKAMVNGARAAGAAELVLLDRTGGDVAIDAGSDVRLLVLSGEPIDEPVVMQGPFAMSSVEEIRNAMADYRAGRFGAIAGAPETA